MVVLVSALIKSMRFAVIAVCCSIKYGFLRPDLSFAQNTSIFIITGTGSFIFACLKKLRLCCKCQLLALSVQFRDGGRKWEIDESGPLGFCVIISIKASTPFPNIINKLTHAWKVYSCSTYHWS